jgi:hypothetical protein
MKEIWCDIKNYEGLYQVSNFGKIRNNKRRIIKQQINRDGYCCVGLYYDKQRKYFTVHRLVAQAFIPNPDDRKYVIHIDHNKQNNHMSNLKWMAASTNKPVYQFDRHGNFINKYKSMRQAAKQLNISDANICICANGITKTAFNCIWLFEDDLDKLADKIKSANEHRYNERGIRINQYDLNGKYIKTYLSGSEVERVNDFDQSAISGCCRGRYKQAYGYIWKYAE